MKKHPLDMAILICLIIIIFLLILLLWPINKSSSKKNDEKSSNVTETVDNNENNKSSHSSTSETLFTNTTKATSEEELVSYIGQIEHEVNVLSNELDTSNGVKESLEDTFITLTDFIFYGGTIKGVTFASLTDTAKEEVLTLYEKIDNTIESKFPNYKENIKSSAGKSYATVVSKASDLKASIISKYKEKIGEEAYNNVVDNFNEDKNRFQDAYTPYVEKGKEVVGSTIDKLDDWYQGFKESRE